MNNTEQDFRFQRQKVHALLLMDGFTEGLTRMQIARILGIERASVCRRVAELNEKGLIWVIKQDLDPITNTKAQFLTANKEIAMRYLQEHPVAKTGNLFE